jgi:hypothetical protein
MFSEAYNDEVSHYVVFSSLPGVRILYMQVVDMLQFVQNLITEFWLKITAQPSIYNSWLNWRHNLITAAPYELYAVAS